MQFGVSGAVKRTNKFVEHRDVYSVKTDAFVIDMFNLRWQKSY